MSEVKTEIEIDGEEYMAALQSAFELMKKYGLTEIILHRHNTGALLTCFDGPQLLTLIPAEKGAKKATARSKR